MVIIIIIIIIIIIAILIHIILVITIIIIVGVVANATSQIRFWVNQLQRIRFVCSRLMCNLS